MLGNLSGKLRLVLVMAMVGMLAVIGAACAGADEAAPAAQASAPQAPKAAAAAAASAAVTPLASTKTQTESAPSSATTSTPVQGGSVDYATSFQSCWDPTTSCSLQSFYNFHAPLIEFNATTGAMEGALAEKWEASADGKTYTITLKKGLTFHDGTPVNAGAIHNQAFLMTDPGSIKERKVSRVRFKDAFDGYDPTKTEYPDGKDGHVIVMHFSKVFAGRLTNMGGPGAHIASPAGLALYGHPGFGTHPVGAGAFKFESIDRGATVTATRFDNFYDAPAPYLERIKDWTVPDATVRDAGLRSNQFQAIYRPLVREIPKLRSEGFNVGGGISLGYTNMDFCHCQPPFDSKYARQAFSAAVDRALILETLEGGYGALGNTTGVSPASPYYKPTDQMTTYEYDLDKARQLLKLNGTPDGFEFTAMAVTITSHILRAQAAAAMVAKVGIKMNIEVMDLGVYFAKTRSNDYQAGWLWIGSYPDIETNSQAFYSLDPSHTNPYTSAKFDELWEKQRTAIDFDDRKSAWWELQDLMAEDLPRYAIYYEKILNGWHPDLHGHVTSPFRDEVWLNWSYWKDGRNP